MPEISRHYTLHLMTLSPLHIGSGRELLQDYDYTVHRNRTWRIDEDALLEAALDGDKFDEALLRRPAAELLTSSDFRLDSGLFRYVIPGKPCSQESGARLHEQIKDAFDRPYLPGSSLKGALRTALLDKALEKDPDKLDTSRLKKNPQWAAQPIERALLGYDPNHDLLRALQVGDSAPLDPNKTLSIENVRVLTERGTSSPIEVEALRPKTELSVPIKLDLSLFTPQAEQKLHFGDKLTWLEALLASCRQRAKTVLKAEWEWFRQYYPRSLIAGFYGYLYEWGMKMPDHQAILNVGWGGGWNTKTLGLRLNERQREEVIHRYHWGKGYRRRGFPFPRSRRVVLNQRGEPIAVFGWVLLEMR